MSEHRRGADPADDDLVRALRRAGSADVGVDVTALVAGARGRARTLRRRRQGVAGVVAVLALGLPLGVSWWGQDPTAVRPVTPATTPPATAVPNEALLTTGDVDAVVPGLELLGQTVSVNSGFCQDDAYDGTDTVVDSRAAGWGGSPTARPGPAEEASLRVLLFRGSAAQDWMAATEQDAQDCTTTQLEGASWTSAPAAVGAEQVVAGYRPATLGDDPAWEAIVVARSGRLVVKVTTTTYQPDGRATLDQAAALASRQLDLAADLAGAGGAAR
ncbi:hypothetical protein AB2L27_08935 [Kineococcus sp. LSe6-4]|uniref:PknH-like extracellular domain-containing protein n=1 Tax=Kineococcus halophytocola TaxID=3234027 RepID=A0ABV4H019_9ACTN